jgi:acyl-CoA reductase-like NAD-dependent aldehyde dehydrogenase
MLESSRIGDPLDKRTMIGPLVDEGQRDTVLRYVEQGRTDGARLVHGGDADGLFVSPALFDGVTPDMVVGREEIFGPVLSVLTFDDHAEAVRLANDTEYGLAAGLWTRDIDVALRTAKAIRAGTVWVNAYHDAGLSVAMPFGGYKSSGFGRELGRDGLGEYLETKSVHVRLGAV